MPDVQFIEWALEAVELGGLAALLVWFVGWKTRREGNEERATRSRRRLWREAKEAREFRRQVELGLARGEGSSDE